jgi:signal transduction histidine kinase
MVVGGPVLLVLASLAAYALTALALRPVERMRQRARGIWTHGLHSRLPQTGARDELDRLAETLNESLDRVESGVRREQGFVADASHELRTPLTVLRAQLELLGSDPALSPELVRMELTSAIEEVDRLSELADHMLLLARAEAGDLEEPAVVEVAPVLERVSARAALLDAGVVSVEEAEPGLAVRAVDARMEQALMNLVDNALRHGGGAATIAVRAIDTFVEFHVLDNGPGFPPGFATAAFERFTRAESARTSGGAGLGMAIVRGLAVAQGGSAGAANRPEVGADAWFSLPRAAIAVERRGESSLASAP